MNFNGEHSWAPGCFVSAVGLDATMVWKYIPGKEKRDTYVYRLKLGV